MLSYKIYTEDKNRDQVVALAIAALGNVTITPAIGAWGKQTEAALVIEHLASEHVALHGTVKGLARAIKALNKQDAVLVTVTPIENSNSWVL